MICALGSVASLNALQDRVGICLEEVFVIPAQIIQFFVDVTDNIPSCGNLGVGRKTTGRERNANAY